MTLFNFFDLLFAPHSPLPHQRKAREGEEGEDQAAGPHQDRGLRRRGGHGEREKDLSAADVWGEGLVPVQTSIPRHPYCTWMQWFSSHGWSSFVDAIFHPRSASASTYSFGLMCWRTFNPDRDQLSRQRGEAGKNGISTCCKPLQPCLLSQCVHTRKDRNTSLSRAPHQLQRARWIETLRFCAAENVVVSSTRRNNSCSSVSVLSDTTWRSDLESNELRIQNTHDN